MIKGLQKKAGPNNSTIDSNDSTEFEQHSMIFLPPLSSSRGNKQRPNQSGAPTASPARQSSRIRPRARQTSKLQSPLRRSGAIYQAPQLPPNLSPIRSILHRSPLNPPKPPSFRPRSRNRRSSRARIGPRFPWHEPREAARSERLRSAAASLLFDGVRARFATMGNRAELLRRFANWIER